MEERLAAGRRRFDEIYGEGAADRLVAAQSGMARDLPRYGVEFGFGDLYGRPGLTLAQRELVTLGVLTALGGLEPQLRGHTKAALRAGLSPTEILETVVHTVQYAGFPRALNAIRVVTDALVENGAELPPPSDPTTP